MLQLFFFARIMVSVSCVVPHKRLVNAKVLIETRNNHIRYVCHVCGIASAIFLSASVHVSFCAMYQENRQEEKVEERLGAIPPRIRQNSPCQRYSELEHVLRMSHDPPESIHQEDGLSLFKTVAALHGILDAQRLWLIGPP